MPFQWTMATDRDALKQAGGNMRFLISVFLAALLAATLENVTTADANHKGFR